MAFRLKPVSVALAFLLCLTVFGGLVSAQSFSADVVSIYGQETMRGKIYISGDKMRLESGGTISITRMDKKVVWLLMPTVKMYTEQSITLRNVVPGAEPSPYEVERTLLGREKVNGYECDKYRVSVKLDKQRQSFLQWLTADSGLPAKIAAEDGKWAQEYRNIVKGDPDYELFEIPKGYEKFGMSLF